MLGDRGRSNLAGQPWVLKASIKPKVIETWPCQIFNPVPNKGDEGGWSRRANLVPGDLATGKGCCDLIAAGYAIADADSA